MLFCECVHEGGKIEKIHTSIFLTGKHTSIHVFWLLGLFSNTATEEGIPYSAPARCSGTIRVEPAVAALLQAVRRETSASHGMSSSQEVSQWLWFINKFHLDFYLIWRQNESQWLSLGMYKAADGIFSGSDFTRYFEKQGPSLTKEITSYTCVHG